MTDIAALVALVEVSPVRHVQINPHDAAAPLVVVYGVTIPPDQVDAYDTALNTLAGGRVIGARRFEELDSDGCAPDRPDHAWSVMQVTYTGAAVGERLPLRVGELTLSA